MRTPVRIIFALGALASLGLATSTRIWSQGDYSDFEKGALKKLSLASDGRVMLAPLSRELFDSASVYLWALAEDSKGNLYAGGGGPGGPGARVYLISRDGKGKTLAQFDDLEVHAIAVDRKDRIYAATSPDGKIYRLAANGKPELFFDPKAKYVWGMAFNSRGELFVATGDRGEIFRVPENGKGEVFYKTSETHARAITVDASDNLIVGTEPGGLIVRVSPKGEGFVLHQAAKREVTAVAVARDGSIYAAAVGSKLPAGAAPSLAPPPSMPAAPPQSPTSPHGGGAAGPQPMPQRPSAGTPMSALPTIVGGSEVYRIGKDGFPQRLWSHPQNIAYAIGFDAEGRALVGTGNRGTIYRLDSDLVNTELLSAPPTQVTAILAGGAGKLYAATGNVGKVYEIGPGLEKEGSIESDVFDAGVFSLWGRLAWRGQLNGGQILVETRSGNLDRPQSDWSAWAGITPESDGGRIASPPARFVQWRLTLKSAQAGDSPRVSAVDVAYLPRNVAPEIQEIEITPANYRFPPQSQHSMAPSPQMLALPPLGRPNRRSTPPMSMDSGAASMQYAKGYIGVRWAAQDDNGDAMAYNVYLRGEKETDWKPLKEKLAEKQYAWDSTAFPDGEYRLRVVASDAPGNPAGQALTAAQESEPFLIDNTPPEIGSLAATLVGGKINVKWKASDALGVIEKAEYSINGGEWTLAEPVGKLSDSRQEDYSLALDRTAPGEQVIAVRVTDEYDNQAVAKVVVR